MPNVTTETKTPYGIIFRSAYQKPLDTLKSLYDEACAARSAADGTPSWDYLDRRASKLAREIDDFVRGRGNAISAWCFTCDRPQADCACVENGGTY